MADSSDKPKERGRGHGEGTFYQRPDGLWVGQIRLGWKDGKRNRVTRHGKTKKEAMAAIAKVKRDHEQGIVSPGQRMTVEEYLDLWMEHSVENTVRPQTLRSYDDVVRLYIKPAIGKKKLHELTVPDVECMINGLLAKGRSPRTAQYARSVLVKALKQAMAWDLIVRNVASLSKSPRLKQHEAAVLLPDEMRAFLAEARKHRLRSLFVIAISEGLREGEALALRWSDIDLERGQLSVRHTLQRVDAQFVFAEPKTKRSRRTLPLPPILVDELKGHRTRQKVERLAAGAVWHDMDLVFCTSIGTPIDRRNLLRIHYGILERAGLSRRPFHDLRHSAASLLLAAGLSQKAIQEHLGHSSMVFTADRYTQLLPSVIEQTSAAIASIMEAASQSAEEA